MKIHFTVTFALTALIGLSSTCLAQWAGGYGELGFGTGYAHIDVGGSSSVLHSMDAWRFEPTVMFSPIPQLPQLRVGADCGFSLVLDDFSHIIIIRSRDVIINNGGSVFIASSGDIPFLLIEPEARVSWKQFLGSPIFIEPGIGLGGAFGQLHVHTENESINEWSSCFAGRAFLNVGFDVPGGSGGITASYLYGGNMDFGANAHGALREFYIGVYGALRF